MNVRSRKAAMRNQKVRDRTMPDEQHNSFGVCPNRMILADPYLQNNTIRLYVAHCIIYNCAVSPFTDARAIQCQYKNNSLVDGQVCAYILIFGSKISKTMAVGVKNILVVELCSIG